MVVSGSTLSLVEGTPCHETAREASRRPLSDGCRSRKNSTRPVATAAGFLPGKSWLAHGIDTVSISGIHCCSRSATSKNTGNVSLPRIDSTGCRISFRPTRGHHTRCPQVGLKDIRHPVLTMRGSDTLPVFFEVAD